MIRIRRALVSTLSAVAISTVGFAVPATAEAGPGADIYCVYKLDNKLHRVSGGCTGATDMGTATGSFEGTYRPNGSAKGKFKLDSRKGSLKGSFRGWYFDGGQARGTYSVTLGTLRISGAFVASLG